MTYTYCPINELIIWKLEEKYIECRTCHGIYYNIVGLTNWQVFGELDEVLIAGTV